MSKHTPPPLDPGAVFVSQVPGRRPRHRRIVAIRAGVVVYCKGGDRNYHCKLASFRRWINRAAAAPNSPQEEPCSISLSSQ